MGEVCPSTKKILFIIANNNNIHLKRHSPHHLNSIINNPKTFSGISFLMDSGLDSVFHQFQYLHRFSCHFNFGEINAIGQIASHHRIFLLQGVSLK